MKKFLISGQVGTEIKKENLLASSLSDGINIFKEKYPNAENIKYKIYIETDNMKNNRVVSIEKNKKIDIDSPEYLKTIIEKFPALERDVLQLHMGFNSDLMYTSTHIARKLNVSEEEIDKALSNGLKRLSDIFQKEKEKAENEDAYNEIRLQMHNKLIKKLRSLKEEWKLDNISQVNERIILAFFKNDLE
tara:strand:+ start:243 stop:812 length:570 start_codon:yes stop_codon:yes gene_type:complete